MSASGHKEATDDMRPKRGDLPIFRDHTDEELGRLLQRSPVYIKRIRQSRQPMSEKFVMLACLKFGKSEAELFEPREEVGAK